MSTLCTERARVVILELGGVSALLGLLGTNKNDGVLKRAASALANLAQNGKVVVVCLVGVLLCVCVSVCVRECLGVCV